MLVGFNSGFFISAKNGGGVKLDNRIPFMDALKKSMKRGNAFHAMVHGREGKKGVAVEVHEDDGSRLTGDDTLMAKGCQEKSHQP